MLVIDDLQPFDILLSYKKPASGLWPLSRPLNQFFDSRLIERQREEYPGGSIEWNHVRIFLGYGVQDVPVFTPVRTPLVGEATFPLSKVSVLKPWMLNPSYCTVYRCTYPIVDPGEAFSEALALTGTLYDVGQLFAMYTGWRRFDWGQRNLVCSVYARYILETATSMSFDSPETPTLNETLPAFFANTPRILSRIS